MSTMFIKHMALAADTPPYIVVPLNASNEQNGAFPPGGAIGLSP